MSKVTNLQAQLEKASGRLATPPPAAAPAPVEQPTVSVYKAPSREGKAHIGAYLHPDFKSSLRLVQAQTGEDTQTLISRALNELFRAHNVPVIDQN
jgi:hypothetical protein